MTRWTPAAIARVTMWAGIVIVAAAAAVLSFTALRELGTRVGFGEWAWLLPIVLDAGAAAGSLVWTGRWAPRRARNVGRTLALTLLGLSVAGNALSHSLTAFFIVPPWWVVVIVSAVAPSVLGAVVHLAVLTVEQPDPPAEEPDREEPDRIEPAGPPTLVAVPTVEPASTPGPVRPAALAVLAPRVDRPVRPAADRPSDETIRAEVQDGVDRTGVRPSQRAVRDAYRVGPARADRILAGLREPVSTDS